MTYRLRLPEELSSVHDTFHVLNLKKCLADANSHVLLDEIKVDKTLHFVEEPLKIMDHEVKTLKRSKIPIVKVRRNSKHGPEFTWECEDHIKAKYPQLLENANVKTNEFDSSPLIVNWDVHVVDELLKRRKEIEWFIDGDFDVYVKRIEKPYVWGGGPELLMASNILK
ncbi:putative reverse transcriptase domain-containing protein [Tanacetum coccineum]